MLQYEPMKWPPSRVVDWADACERQTWVAELRRHIFNIFVLGVEGLKPRRPRGWTLTEIRESISANYELIGKMLHLAGAPLEGWQKMHIALPAPKFADPPEIATRLPSPFEDLPRYAWSDKELTKWLGYVVGELEYLAHLLLEAYPEGSEEQRRARWAVIRLHVLFKKLEVALGVTKGRT
jgi:hypothetical protein